MKAKLITVLFLICLVNIQPMLQGMSDPGAVDAIVSHCPHLKILDLSDLIGLGEGLVEALRNLPEEQRSRLEILYLSRTGVTEEHMDALRELLQNCEISYR